MKRVVLDTNVLFSACRSAQGTPAKIIEKVVDGTLQSFVSVQTIEEAREVLLRNQTLPLALEFLEIVREVSTLVHPQIRVTASQDPDDDKFLEYAIAAHVDVIISGDQHLLKLKEFRGIPILSPREFLERKEGHL